MRLKDKRILITGASSGIGRQAAIQCSREGAILYITGRNEERLQETMSVLIGNNHHLMAVDLNDENGINSLVDSCEMLDGIVYSAGLTSHIPVQFINQHQIDSMMKTNFFSPMLLISKLLSKKKIANGASLVFLSSIATKLPYFGGALYSASKAALEAYSKTLALEFASKKIRSNVICPSFVNTQMVEDTEKTISKESIEKMKMMHPLGFGETTDVAHSILFLLSDESSWISGTKIELGGI